MDDDSLTEYAVVITQVLHQIYTSADSNDITDAVELAALLGENDVNALCHTLQYVRETGEDQYVGLNVAKALTYLTAAWYAARVISIQPSEQDNLHIN